MATPGRQSDQRPAHLNQPSEELEREVRRLLGHERRMELDSIEHNLKQIGQHLRALHKAGGRRGGVAVDRSVCMAM